MPSTSHTRKTATHACEQLIAEGYLETRTGAGTFIADADQIVDDGKSSRGHSEHVSHAGLSTQTRGTQLFKC